jgi:hypothetical protein
MSLQLTEIRELHYTISTAIREKHYLRRRQREIQERKPCKTAEDTTTPNPRLVFSVCLNHPEEDQKGIITQNKIKWLPPIQVAILRLAVRLYHLSEKCVFFPLLFQIHWILCNCWDFISLIN